MLPTLQKMLKNKKDKVDALLQKTYTKDYIRGIREKTQYYVKNNHLAMIDSELLDEVQAEMFCRV